MLFISSIELHHSELKRLSSHTAPIVGYLKSNLMTSGRKLRIGGRDAFFGKLGVIDYFFRNIDRKWPLPGPETEFE
jgi:hypothetical protein